MSLSKKSVTTLSILALIFPLIYFSASIAYNITHKETASQWRIHITGYDPRDLLKGRYLRYRFDWNIAEGDSLSCDKFRKNDCCICLTEKTAGDKKYPKAKVMSCRRTKRRQCDGIARSESDNGNFNIGLRKYFVDERVATPLDRLLRRRSGDSVNFDLDLLLAPSSKQYPVIDTNPQLGELYVNGEPLSKLVREGTLNEETQKSR